VFSVHFTARLLGLTLEFIAPTPRMHLALVTSILVRGNWIYSACRSIAVGSTVGRCCLRTPRFGWEQPGHQGTIQHPCGHATRYSVRADRPRLRLSCARRIVTVLRVWRL
jgi:hypothetical protein